MAELKIVYGGFWDHPHELIVMYQGLQYIFWREYDDEMDKYPDEYDVLTLDGFPELSEHEINGSWDRLHEQARLIGKIVVNDVAFDPTHRRSIDTSTFERIMRTDSSL